MYQVSWNLSVPQEQDIALGALQFVDLCPKGASGKSAGR